MSGFFDIAAKASEAAKPESNQAVQRFDADKRIDVEKDKKDDGKEKRFDPDKRIDVQEQFNKVVDDKDGKAVIELNNDQVEAEVTKEVISDVELYNSSEKRLEQALQGEGEWKGEPGKSEFIPRNQEARQILKESGLESIRYDANCEPDFSLVSKGTVQINNMTERRLGEGGNYDQAFQKLAEQWNSEMKDGKSDWNSRDVARWTADNKLSPHERMDRKTVDFVPKVINLECKHIGGCSECKLRDARGGGFDV